MIRGSHAGRRRALASMWGLATLAAIAMGPAALRARAEPPAETTPAVAEPVDPLAGNGPPIDACDELPIADQGAGDGHWEACESDPSAEASAVEGLPEPNATDPNGGAPSSSDQDGIASDESSTGGGDGAVGADGDGEASCRSVGGRDGAAPASLSIEEVSGCGRSTGPDLQVTKTSSAVSVLHRGDEFVYTIAVRNDGDEPATGVEIHDVLPAGVDVLVPPLPAFRGDFCTVASSVVVPGVPVTTVDCGPGSLGSGETASIHVRVEATGRPCGPITNAVDVEASDEPAGHLGAENHAEVTDVVACEPGIELRAGGPALAHVADPVTYAFDATNTGGVDLTDVELTDPACETPIVQEDDGDGDEVLSAGERWSFRCGRTIRTSDGDPVRNVATIRADHDDGTVADTDGHDVDVIHPDIALSQTASPSSGTAGTPVVYTYRVANTGDTRLFGVSVDDDIVGHVATIEVIAPGRTVEVTQAFTLGPSPVTNVGTAEGEDVLGASVSATDTATVAVVAGGAGDAPGGTPFTGADTRGAIAGVLALAACGLLLLVAGSRLRVDERPRPARR